MPAREGNTRTTASTSTYHTYILALEETQGQTYNPIHHADTILYRDDTEDTYIQQLNILGFLNFS